MIQAASLGRNTVFNAATAVSGVRLDPYLSFNFFVEIEGVLAGAFSECSGLEVETQLQDYQEGGLNEYTHHFVGPTRYPPLVLKHGLSPLDGLWTWHQETANRVIRRNGTVYLLSRQRQPLMWWNFVEALIYKWTGPDLRADSANVAFERVELVHRGLKRPLALTRAASAAGGSTAANPFVPNL